MSLEELTQRATITFPILATVEDMERLFCYFRQEAGLITDYSLEVHKRVGDEFEKPIEDNTAIVRDYELKGNITVPSSSVKAIVRGIYEKWDFHCPGTIGEDNKPYFSGMRFFTTPGWSLGDYRQGTLQLWDQVRELTGKYVELRKIKTSE